MRISDWSSDVCSSDLFHAEAFSAAEVRHGPMALVGKGFPVLLLAQDDATRDSVAALAHDFAARGATLLHAGLGDAAGLALPVLDAAPAIQPLLMIARFYPPAHALAVAPGPADRQCVLYGTGLSFRVDSVVRRFI